MTKNNKLIKFLSLTIVCISFLCFQACKHLVNDQLKQAELLIKNKPDSAFLILTNIRDNYAGMNDSEKALFGYLYFRAWDDRGHKDSADVSQIDFSIDYYNTKYSDKQRLAECYLYQSRVFKEKTAYTEAITNE